MLKLERPDGSVVHVDAWPPFTILGLRPDARYSVSVAAGNSVGLSNFSQIVRIWTKPPTPASPDVYVSPSDQSVLVGWDCTNLTADPAIGRVSLDRVWQGVLSSVESLPLSGIYVDSFVPLGGIDYSLRLWTVNAELPGGKNISELSRPSYCYSIAAPALRPHDASKGHVGVGALGIFEDIAGGAGEILNGAANTVTGGISQGLSTIGGVVTEILGGASQIIQPVGDFAGQVVGGVIGVATDERRMRQLLQEMFSIVVQSVVSGHGIEETESDDAPAPDSGNASDPMDDEYSFALFSDYTMDDLLVLGQSDGMYIYYESDGWVMKEEASLTGEDFHYEGLGDPERIGSSSDWGGPSLTRPTDIEGKGNDSFFYEPNRGADQDSMRPVGSVGVDQNKTVGTQIGARPEASGQSNSRRQEVQIFDGAHFGRAEKGTVGPDLGRSEFALPSLAELNQQSQLPSSHNLTNLLGAVGWQATWDGYLRSAYAKAVANLNADDVFARTFLKSSTRTMNSPVTRAFLNAFRPIGFPIGEGISSNWHFANMVGVEVGSAGSSNPSANLGGKALGVIGPALVTISLYSAVIDTVNSRDPYATAVERAFGLAGATIGSYVGGTLCGIVGSILGPPGEIGGAIYGTIQGSNLGTRWGEEFGGWLLDVMDHERRPAQ